MMKALRILQAKIDNLDLRERGLVLCGALLLMYFVFESLVLQPLEVKQKKAQNALLQKNGEIIVLNSQLQQTLTASKDSKEERSKREVQRLRQELATLDQALNSATADLVTPQQMAKLLQNVLGQTDGLRLIKVTSLGSTPLLLNGDKDKSGKSPQQKTVPEPGAETTAASTAYKHGLRIEFQGNFFTTMDYLRKLEGLEWKFFWDELDYKVIDYPDATGSLSLYTISLDKNWIGV